jgi:hypothetical protein
MGLAKSSFSNYSLVDFKNKSNWLWYTTRKLLVVSCHISTPCIIFHQIADMLSRADIDTQSLS